MGPGILVFVMTGCPACHEFVPRLKRLAAPYVDAGMPVKIVDITKDQRGAAFADHIKVNATPTTVAYTRRGKTLRKVGAVPDKEIEKLLRAV